MKNTLNTKIKIKELENLFYDHTKTIYHNWTYTWTMTGLYPYVKDNREEDGEVLCYIFNKQNNPYEIHMGR